MDPSLDFLERLFGEDGRPAVGNTGVKLRVVRRAGYPFLLLPRHPREAVATLSLYAPQTIRARAFAVAHPTFRAVPRGTHLFRGIAQSSVRGVSLLIARRSKTAWVRN